MRRTVSALLLAAAFFPTSAFAQSKVDLSTLPAEIKTLKWQSVDVSKLSPLQRCQALLVLNDVLDEMNAQMTVEADLMSDYIDTKNLGSQFASQPPVTGTPPLTMANAQQIAAALLQGPMASSPYSTQLTDSPADVLTAYENMYQSTCQSKWSALVNNKLRVRAMSLFLQAQGKMPDYQAWVPGEIQRQADQQAAELAARQAAAAAKQQEKQEAFMQKQAQLIQQQQQQIQQQQQAAQKMQQALASAQQQSAPAAAQNTAVVGGYPDYYYGGWGALGASAWYRNGAYLGAAAARTDARIGAWHGAGGFGGRR